MMEKIKAEIAEGSYDPMLYSVEELREILPYLSTKQWWELAKTFYSISNRVPNQELSKIVLEFNYKTRTVHSLIATYKKITALNIEPPKDISWRLLQEVFTHINEWNYKELFAFLRCGASFDEIKAAMKERTFFDFEPL